jgi:hypothetical protein
MLTKYVVKSSFFHENIVSKNTEVNLSDPLIKKKLKKKIVILNGWNIRDRMSFIKYEKDIKRIFSPSRVHEQNISLFITRLREENEILVGVHIRLGDYADWLGGKYFYSLQVYVQKCLEMLNELKHLNKKVLFVLCSNASIDLSVFSRVNVCQSTGHIIEDLYILSSCDFIFGPPSTYSMWASFYGGKPLFHVTNKEKVLKVEYFDVHSELIPKTF